MSAQARELLPALAPIGRAEKRRIFNPRINRVGIAKRGLDMPHPLELPRMLCAVVPLVRSKRLAGFSGGVIDEAIRCLVREGRHGRVARLQPRLLPVLSAIVGALQDLPKPAA